MLMRFETINKLSLAHSGKISAASLSDCIFRLKSAHVVVVTDIGRGTKCAPGAFPLQCNTAPLPNIHISSEPSFCQCRNINDPNTLKVLYKCNLLLPNAITYLSERNLKMCIQYIIILSSTIANKQHTSCKTVCAKGLLVAITTIVRLWCV